MTGVNGPLESGDKLVRQRKSVEVIVTSFIGEGGQGWVYAARVGTEVCAVKWYKPQALTDDPGLRDRLNRLVDDIVPPGPKFLWPIDIVTAKGKPDFGYIMPLKEPRFRDFKDVLANNVDPQPSFRAILTACIELANEFWLLHADGLCYVDVNDGNMAMDCDTGEIRIVDCDNIDVNGATTRLFGFPGYMAPEVVMGRAWPTRETDWWSLAVLLFRLLLLTHPLDGRKAPQMMDLESMRRHYGPDALYIFDPDDRSNAPDQGAAAPIYRKIYPRFLLARFDEAFTTGLRRPEDRVTEPTWQRDLIKCRDLLMVCANCANDNFFDAEETAPRDCWNCGHKLPQPLLLNFRHSKVVVSDKMELAPHHVDPDRIWDFSSRTACGNRHPRRRDVLGLKNLSDGSWTAQVRDGRSEEIKSGESVRLEPGLKISFGRTEGEVS
jgi:eukaryotic-like serine/threonine-protein kinase